MQPEFWLFSLRYYDDARIQIACLELQDRYGGDVNVALYLLWHARTGSCLTDADVMRIDSSVAAWRTEVVQPIRAMRRTLKEVALLPDLELQMTFRDKIKCLELEAEKAEQAILAQVEIKALDTREPTSAARHNLAAYGRTLCAGLGDDLIVVLSKRLSELVSVWQINLR
jgi:uncharacterized protein (TIGR02444 family)